MKFTIKVHKVDFKNGPQQYKFLKIYFGIYLFFQSFITFILIMYTSRLWEYYARV